jgi:hypothetical protein
VGEALYNEAHGARIVGGWGGRGRETVNRKRKLSAVFLQPIQNPSYMSHVLLLCISFLRVLVVLYLRDMYMCRLRLINGSVLSSLKMEGIRLLFLLLYVFFVLLYAFFCVVLCIFLCCSM